MGKSIGKTILFTLISLVCAFVIGFTMACMIAPMKLSNFVLQLSMLKFATVLAVYEYDRSEDINDLGITVERSISSESYDTTVKYGEILIAHERYGEFVNFKNINFDEENSSNIEFNYDNFIEANYVYALYKENGFSLELFNKATAFVSKSPNEYQTANAVSMIVKAFIESEQDYLSGELANNPKTSIENYLVGKYDALTALNSSDYNSYRKNICADMFIMYDHLNNEDKKKEWNEKFLAI